MFEIGWSELLVIGVVALIVIGPKDLPEMFRTLGRFTAKARSMAREFSRAMESAANESGLKDMAKDVKSAADGMNVRSSGLDTVKEAARKFESWDPLKHTRPGTQPTSTPATPPAAAKILGPETQALADAQAAKREAIKASAAPVAADTVKPEGDA